MNLTRLIKTYELLICQVLGNHKTSKTKYLTLYIFFILSLLSIVQRWTQAVKA